MFVGGDCLACSDCRPGMRGHLLFALPSCCVVCKAKGSILDIGTIFDNQTKLFVGNPGGISMELDLFHGI